MKKQEQELKHMKRSDLVEIIYQYQQNEKKLFAENDELRRQLDSRRIEIDQAGSIADAALSLSGVFQAAQAAADLYLAQLKLAAEDIDRRTRQCLEQAQEQADTMKRQTERECWELRASTENECSAMREKIMELMRSHDELRIMMSAKTETVW